MQICRSYGILSEELYYIDYKDYCALHPEISSLPNDIKKYRYDLLEEFRKKTIEQIKEQRSNIINFENGMKEEKNNSSEQDVKNNLNKTFSEKMKNMIDNEKKNIEKIKKKQKQNIEYLIENQMKAELINSK